MNTNRQKVFDYLNSMNISYNVIEHAAVYTIDEIDNINIDSKDEIVKNLFVRDEKKERYFLIVLQKYKKADLKKLREQISCKRLSFASENDLYTYMGLTKGSVSPFGVLNDTSCIVEVIIDKDILLHERIGVHPNDNTATVWIKPKDLEFVIKNHGNSVKYVEI